MSDDTKTTVVKKSGLAIAGLVLGIIALLTSVVPIVNNISFILALVGFVLSAVGVFQCIRGKRGAKGLAIGAVVVNVLACVLVLGSQQMYSDAIDDAMEGPQVSHVDSDDDSKEGEKDEQVTTNLAAGASVTLENGLSITVDSVQGDITDYDGSKLIAVHVTYVNGGEDGASYNSYDWKGESATGAQEDPQFYMDGEEPLESGTLAADGTVSGTVYFKGDSVKALYMGGAFQDTPKASWKLA